jgi:rubrerythrin
MSTLLDEARLELEYARRFAAQKLADDDQGATLYGATPAERMQSLNWLHWCEQAALCTRFCRLCGLPMDPVEDTHPDDRCPICAAMEAALFQGDYWKNLPKVDYSPEDRGRMGLG